MFGKEVRYVINMLQHVYDKRIVFVHVIANKLGTGHTFESHTSSPTLQHESD